ncbi:MAG: branched-chain amino acid ABC transporter permease [Desulfuromonadales bacterium]|nr:branched-chain amino acid ABC transporter permease [Desulfuromonadales bacterium]
MQRELLKFALFAAVVLVVAPLYFQGGYILNVLVFVGINTMLAIGLNLLLGFAGQISLGQAAFYGLGAYVSAILTTTHGFNPWLSMIFAALAIGALAFVIGFPILKLKGHYLAMATLGFGIIVYIVINEYVDLTGGPSGFPGIPNLSIGSFSFDSDMKNYYLIWGATLGVMLLAINLARSRIGRALRAIHDSEVAAQVLGINARLLKVQIFACSAMISSLAGSLYAHYITFVSPSTFGFGFSVELLTMVVIGGLGSIYGSFLGATLITLLPEILRTFHDYDIVFYGALLMIMTIFLPGGLIQGGTLAWNYLRKSWSGKGGADA